jgi:calcium channel MID1
MFFAMQLSPLQSRLAASVVASCLLVLLYFSLFSPHFALAIEISPSETVLLDELDLPLRLDGSSSADPTYEPAFAAFDRSLIGRAPAGVTVLGGNIPQSMSAAGATVHTFVFDSTAIFGSFSGSRSLELRDEPAETTEKRSELEGRNVSDRAAGDNEIEKRQSTRTVYISGNTCTQPQPASPNQGMLVAPQLILYVSTSPNNQNPGPQADASSQQVVMFTEGAVMYNLTATADVYFSVQAPNITSAFSGGYTYEVAASIDASYHSFSTRRFSEASWVDSDSSSALFVTRNLTDGRDEALNRAMMSMQPYVMFAQDASDGSINGLRLSFCGLQNSAQISAIKNNQTTNMVSSSMTRRGPGHRPKQQFYFRGLNSSTRYQGILAMNGTAGRAGAGVVGGGGLVFRATNFTTKSGK